MAAIGTQSVPVGDCSSVFAGGLLRHPVNRCVRDICRQGSANHRSKHEPQPNSPFPRAIPDTILNIICVTRFHQRSGEWHPKRQQIKVGDYSSHQTRTCRTGIRATGLESTRRQHRPVYPVTARQRATQPASNRRKLSISEASSFSAEPCFRCFRSPPPTTSATQQPDRGLSLAPLPVPRSPPEFRRAANPLARPPHHFPR
jgi:hypothetical protein